MTPSLRAISTASYSPASEAITCATRESRFLAMRSRRSSSATLASSGSDATGSAGAYREWAPPTLGESAATADWPCRPMARAAAAASSSAASEMSSEYAKACFSPCTARMPTPRSMLNEPALTMPSSRLQLSIREYWK